MNQHSEWYEPYEGCEKRGGICDCFGRPCYIDTHPPDWWEGMFFMYFSSKEEALDWLNPDDASEDDIEQKFYQENDRFHEWEKWIKDEFVTDKT